MSSALYVILSIIILFAITVITRALPFIFTQQMKNNHLMDYLGKHLPSAIIFLLVIYYMTAIAKPSDWTNLPWQLIGIAVVIFCHWRWRNMMLSLVAGTASYLILQLY